MVGVAKELDEARKAARDELVAEIHGHFTYRMHSLSEFMKTLKANGTVLPHLGMAAMLRCRVRYFTDGSVVGSKSFVNAAFAGARERFTAKRKDGARRAANAGEWRGSSG